METIQRLMLALGATSGFDEHAFDITSVDFDNEVSYADEVESKCAECTIEAIKFKLGL
jgi:hypothetical protein